MVQMAGFSNSFAAGELSPDAWERSDLQQHASGCDLALNMIGLVAGPNASRGGFKNMGAAKFGTSARRFFPWNRANGEGLVLEMGEAYIRVWTARGARLPDGGGGQVEFAHGYDAAAVQGLRLRQVGDIGYFTSRDGLLNAELRRISDTVWSFDLVTYKDGPFLPENTDTDRTMTLTEVSPSNWVMAASFDIFTSGHVGAQFRIRGEGGAVGHRTWAPNTAFGAGEYCVSAGRIYSNETGATNTGNTAPTHDRGTSTDGAISWKFRHDGEGVVTILTVSDPRNVTLSVPHDIPVVAGGASTATSNWSEGAFSNARGWPTCLTAAREERIFQGATAYQPDTLYGTRSFGFTATVLDFKPGLGTGLVADDDSVSAEFGTARARIVWVVDALNLIVGTTQDEWILSGTTTEDPIVPSDTKPRRISAHGSADVMPVVLQGPPALILHLARGAKALRELELAGSLIAPSGRDLSVLCQHVFGLGVVDMAWTASDHTLWLQLKDGSLAAFTYHYEQGVMGVRRQQLPPGFAVETLCAAPDPDGTDLLHVGVVRTKGGAQQRLHLVLAQRDEGVFLDIAGTYAGAPATVISGLGDLEGESVAILADGAQIPDQVVAGGAVTLADPASQVVVGLRMMRRFRSLPFDPDRQGTAIAKKARPTQCYIVFGGVTVSVYAEAQDEPTGQVPQVEVVTTRRPGDAAPVVRRKRHKVNLGGGADRDNRIVMETDEPFDLVVYALRPVEDVS